MIATPDLLSECYIPTLIMFSSEADRSQNSTLLLDKPIGEIEGLLKGATSSILIEHKDLQRTGNVDGKPSNRFYLSISPFALSSILDAVRHLVLEWALKLEEQGIMGDGMSFSETEKQAAVNNPNIHIGAVYGQVSVNNDSTDNSTNTVNVNVSAAFDALRKASEGIADEPTRTDALRKIDDLANSKDNKSAMEKVGPVAALISHGINIYNTIRLHMPQIMTWIDTLPK